MARPTPKNDRAQRAATMQREAKRQDRRRSLLIWGAMGLVLALIVGAVGFAIARRPSLAGVSEYEDLS
ncbi:MAG: hypothetical protein WA962_09320, partial [Ornithinimicrobium sp.]